MGGYKSRKKDPPLCTSFKEMAFEKRGKGVEGNHGWGRSCFLLHLFAESEAHLGKGRNTSQGSPGAPPPPQACSRGSNALAHFIHHPVYPSLSPASVGEERRCQTDRLLSDSSGQLRKQPSIWWWKNTKKSSTLHCSSSPLVLLSPFPQENNILFSPAVTLQRVPHIPSTRKSGISLL